jgi:hypothetical protein
VSGALLTNDRFGFSNKAYSFNGNNDHILVPYDLALKPDFPFTISLWFKIDDFGSTSSILYASDELSNRYSGFWLGYLPSGTISAGYGNGQGHSSGNRVTKVSNTLVNTSTWYNVVAVYNDLNDIDLYIDCILDPGYYSGSASYMNNGSSNSAIGRSLGHTTAAYHNGQIDDIRLYDRAIDLEGIRALCSEGRDTATENNELTSSDFKLYPNPASDFLTISSNKVAKSKIDEISVLDINGKLLNTVSNESHVIDIRELSPGIYFVHISTNEQTITKKFIKQ